ncbi:RdgB/HAM1 family non-canonical purine NTP pyrophosphatase [Patescibacteria group bacterium]|nr:RdgB/HAM1 family non-canonical purine NTP pyrophosphatase [Patescibacteria group bacterium]
MKLLVATNNKAKQQEFSQILSQTNFELVFPEDVGLSDLDVAETGESFVENAWIKAQEFARLSGLLSVADDSGLEVEALGGAPGIHSKRFSSGTDEDRCKKIISLLDGQENRRAHFRSVLVLVDPKEKVDPDFSKHQQDLVFEGIFAGTIAFAISGKEGFGYDPIFIPEGETKTVAELGQDYKNQHSHRAQAIQKLAEYLERQNNA